MLGNGGEGVPQSRIPVALTGSSTVVGLHWQSVGSGSTSFVGSVPLPGKVQVSGVFLSADRGSAVEDPHRFQFAVATGVPGSQAVLDEAQQVFAAASQVTGERSGLLVCAEVASVFLPVSSVIGFRGRRLVGGFYNGNSRTVDAYAAFVVHRVSGGALVSAFGFLWGESVRGV